jgi:hypothetical protein
VLEQDVLVQESEVETGGKRKADKGPSVLDVVKQILERHGEGRLAQIGETVHKDTDSEQGFVDFTNDIQREACLLIGRCPRRSGVMSALESFIAVPQASAHKATPFFFWRTVDESQFTPEERLLNNHWEPVVLPSTSVVFSDGVLDLKANKFQSWAEIGHKLYGPKIMMRHDEVLNAKPNDKFREFKSTLSTVLPDSSARLYFQKVMGGLLRPHVNIKKAIFIQGAAGSRKSTIATALLCAPAGVGGFSIEEIDDLAENRFSQASLLNKWANLSDDPDGKAQKWVGWFKRYTGGSIMRGEFKKVQSKNYPITAKLVVCCNAIPRMGDSSDAVWARLIVFKFARVGELDAQFRNDTADNTKLQAEYWCDKETRAAILRWQLEGLQASLTEGMVAPEIVKTWNNEACGEADPCRALLMESYELGTDTDFVSTSEVRATLENMGHQLTNQSLAQYMRTLYNLTPDRGTIEGKTVRGFHRLKRKD